MKKNTVFIIFLVAAIAFGLYFRQFLSVELLEQLVKDAGISGILLFAAIYAIGTVLFLPGLVMALAGGALYGPLLGTLINLTSATIGATMAFFIARYFAATWVEEKIGGKLKTLKTGIEAEGWKFVAFTRLVPLFPFNLLNYALGLTNIGSLRYIVCTFLFMLPGSAAYTYLGYLGKEAAKGEEGLVQKILLGLGIFVLLLFIPRIAGYFRRGKSVTVVELHDLLQKKHFDLLLDVRSENEFIMDPGHILEATNIVDSNIRSNPGILEKYREKKIAVICRTDRRSASVAQFLSEQGFADVHVVVGGMVAWQQRGYSIKQGK